MVITKFSYAWSDYQREPLLWPLVWSQSCFCLSIGLIVNIWAMVKLHFSYEWSEDQCEPLLWPLFRSQSWFGLIIENMNCSTVFDTFLHGLGLLVEIWDRHIHTHRHTHFGYLCKIYVFIHQIICLLINGYN